MAVDVRGRGDTTPRTNGRPHPAMDAESFLAYEAMILGRPLFGMRMRDAQVAIDYLTARPDVRPDGVALAGWGAGGLLVLHLAAVDARVRAVATVDGLTSYRSLVEHEHYRFPTGAIVPGVVRGPDSPEGYEVDELAAGIAGGADGGAARPVLRLRNVDHLGQPVDPAPEDDAALAESLATWLQG
jgi:hypothetical protein